MTKRDVSVTILVVLNFLSLLYPMYYPVCRNTYHFARICSIAIYFLTLFFLVAVYKNQYSEAYHHYQGNCWSKEYDSLKLKYIEKRNSDFGIFAMIQLFFYWSSQINETLAGVHLDQIEFSDD